LSWTRSIGGLGFRDGISRQGLDGTLEAYFSLPLPVRLSSGNLALVFESHLPSGARGTAEIALDGMVRASLTLSQGLHRLTTSLAVEQALLADGHLKVAVRFAGVLSDDRCADERLGGLSFTLLPESALTLSVARVALVRPDDAWALLPERLRVVLPQAPLAPAEYETALKLAVALERWGHEVSFATAPADTIRDNRAVLLQRGIAADEPIRVRLPDGVPVLSLAADGSGSEEGEHLARWLEGDVPPLPSLDAPIPLSTLGGESGSRIAAPRAEWSLPLSLGRLPPGTIPDSLSLVLVTPSDVEASAHLLHVFIDGTLIASRRLRPQGATRRVTIPLRPDTLNVDSRAQVVFERVEASPVCLGSQRALPVALLPESALALREDGNPRDFAGLVPQFARGVEFRLPRRFLDAPLATLPLVTAVARDFVRAPWHAHLQFMPEGRQPRLSSPFVDISADPPPGAVPPLSFDRGAVSIVDRTNRELVRLEGNDAATLAQVVEVHGQAGLWIRPALASLPAAPDTTALARGNVALIDGDGVALWFDTHAERGLIVRYADTSLLASHFAHVWAWIIAGIWLLLTLAVFHRARFRRRDDP
jgi:hypothetical protein